MKKIYKYFYTWVWMISMVLLWFGNFSIANAARLRWWWKWFDNDKHIICKWDSCNPDDAKELVGAKIDGIVTDRSASVYIQDVINYLLWFITLIAILYVIYAGFRILTAAWDDETVGKQKKTILYVAIGIIVIWLAWSIVKWVVWVVTAPPSTGTTFHQVYDIL